MYTFFSFQVDIFIMDCQPIGSPEKSCLYECTLCRTVYFGKKMYKRHKSLCHKGIQMKERTYATSVDECTQWILDDPLSETGTRRIFTCSICRLSFMNESMFQNHLREKHADFCVKFSTVDCRNHISIQIRGDKRCNLC